MNMFSDPLNLVLLVAAVTLFVWLRSVLGQRTGFERSEKPVEILPPEEKNAEATQPMKVISNDWNKHTQSDVPAQAIDQLRQRHPDFDLEHFISGAIAAHEMILVAFADGDKKTLKPLLSKSVFESFEKVIDENSRASKSKLFKFVGIKSAKISAVDARDNSIAIAVNFATEIVPRDENSVTTQNENWTFEKETGAKDPNWKLVATQDPAATHGDSLE
jgi:predicted lipid-binding transport protein (Tim44 family)